MGCFSYICQKTDEPVLSTTFNGDNVYLFLLKDGKVIEYMHGNYDSYGRVFKNVKKGESFEWQMDWGDVCDLHFDLNLESGIAAILGDFWDETQPFPTERSKDDPNQGWGKHGELLFSYSKNFRKKVKNPFHKVLIDGKFVSIDSLGE